ncbi:MAG: hypothetical protein AB7F28_00635 [Candidatus Margulisiibacteriota bacterium]
MIQKSLAMILGLFLLATPAVAGGNYLDITDIGSSARAIRLGQVEGFSPYANSVFENPAALYRIRRFSVSAFTSKLMDEANFKNVAVSMRMPYGVIGLGLMSVDVGDLKKTQAIGVESNVIGDLSGDWYISETGETFGYSSLVAKVSYSVSQTRNLHFGVSGVYYSNSIEKYTGSGFNMDAGMVLDTGAFNTSITLKNVIAGLKVNYNNGGSETLPLQAIYAVRYTMGDFQLHGQIKTVGSNKMLRAASLNYRPSFVPFFQVSGGYREFNVITDVKSGLALGIGLEVNGINFDYAMQKSDHIQYDNNHYFSVSLNL